MTNLLSDHKWGGSGIEEETFQFIMNHYNPKETTILEIGAGYCSTKAFSTYYKLYSLENDINYCNLFNSHYIHAPLINGWYDIEKVKLIPHDYQLIFLDGPVGEGNRSGFLSNIELFNNKADIIVHDTYRPAEHQLAIEIADKLNKKIDFHHNIDFIAHIY